MASAKVSTYVPDLLDDLPPIERNSERLETVRRVAREVMARHRADGSYGDELQKKLADEGIYLAYVDLPKEVIDAKNGK